MSVKITIESTGTGTCALSGKEGAEGITAAFENEPPLFLSWKSFQQILHMKVSQKPPAKAAVAQPAASGNP